MVVENRFDLSSATMIKLFFSGLAAALPIATGYFPVAITFGIVTVNSGLLLLDAVIASALVFAGAAQFMAIGMYGTAATAGAATAVSVAAPLGPAAIVQIVVAGSLLNLRHLLMSSLVAHNLAVRSPAPGPATRSLVAFGLTDEVFSVAGLRITAGERLSPAYLLGLELGAYAAWVGGTAVGATLGDVLPPILRTAMGFALYALFAALLAGQIRAGRTGPLLLAAGTAAAVNVLLRSIVGAGPGVAFPLAMIAGALAGWFAAGRSPGKAAAGGRVR